MEVGNVKDESGQHDEDLPEDWKTETQSLSKQVQVSEMEKVVTASTSKIIPSVSTVLYGAGVIQINTGNGKFMEKVKESEAVGVLVPKQGSIEVVNCIRTQQQRGASFS
jgi:hypothetical protein